MSAYGHHEGAISLEERALFPMTDNRQSDVVEAWDRLTGCANACGFPSIEAAIEHLADIHLASLSTKDDKSPRERLAAKVGVAIANRANLGDEPPISTKDSDAVLEEQAAKRIYEHWSFGTWFKGDKPAWVEGGNSEAQVLARMFAHAAIRKGRPGNYRDNTTPHQCIDCNRVYAGVYSECIECGGAVVAIRKEDNA